MAKKTKCFADGGAIGSDGLTDEQRAKKNAALSSLGISSAPAPVPQPQAQNPAPPPKPQQQGIGSGIIGILKGRQQQIDKAAGYANGGIINDELLYAGPNGRGATELNMEWETRHLSPEAKAQYFIERDKVALEASKVRNGYANGGIIRGPGTARSDSIANGGVIHNAAEYWADDNAQFEKTNPEFVDRVVRALNPMTGVGSAMGAMHTAASSGDVPGMVMAGATAIPAFGVLRAVPAVGAAKATVAPSLRKTMASLVGGATANAASDEYQSKNNSGLATGGVVGAKTFEFEGKGTGTSDDIPVKVAGNHVNVSNGEKGKAKPESQPQPAPQPAPQPDPQPQQRGLIDNAMNLFGSRGKQIDKASGYRDGGKIQGPGTARSDSIDATVRETGEPIKVSNGERIVSAAQENVLQGIARGLGFDGLDALLEHGTGRPVGPTIKGGKRAAADGMSPEEKEWRLKTGNLMSEYPGKPSEYNAAASRMLPPVFPDGFGAKVNPDAPPVGLDKAVSGIAGMFSDAARASNTAETKSYEQLRAERAGTQQQAQPVGKPSDLPGASLSNEDRSVPVPITTAQSPTSQSRQVNNERGIITADTASASMSSPMTRRGGIAGSYDGKGVNDILERENKARAGMIDSMIAANGGNGVGIVGQEAADATARDNAEKTRRWRNDELVSLATRGNQGAIASLINAEGGRGVAEMGNETQRRNAELAAQVANNRDKLTMRGQDLNAQNELARLLGNPLDQQSKQLELKKQGIISGLFDKANSGDQEALAKYNALVNGSKEPNYSNRYITLPNRKTYNDMGQITGEEPGGVFDAKTGQLANFGKQGTGVNIEEANKIKAAVASGAMKREDAIKKLQAMGLQ